MIKGEEGQLHENLSLEKEKQSTGEDKKPLEELICHICSKFFDRPNRLQVIKIIRLKFST